MPDETQTQAPAAGLGGRPVSTSWVRRHPVAIFLAALLLTLLTMPLDNHIRDGDLFESVRLTVLMLFALLAVGGRRKAVGWGLVLVLPALVCKWLNHWRPDRVPAVVFLVPAILFLLFVVANLLRFILRASRIDSEVLCAGVAGYLMLGLLWGVAYALVARVTPNAFAFTAGPPPPAGMSGPTTMYFSFITLSTVGYGDIVPLSGAARMLAMMEAVTGTLYLAVLVARLVSLYSTPPAESRT